MTWDEALRHADAQIAEWQRLGIGPATALIALHDKQLTRWPMVREQLAAWGWLMARDEKWED